MKQLQEGAGSTELVRGHGDDEDTLETGKVYVYDTASFPAYTAERRHQFRNDIMEHYPSEYRENTRFTNITECPGDGRQFLVFTDHETDSERLNGRLSRWT